MWYAAIADLYDGLVRFEDDIPFFLEQCRAAGGPVLELMAGTGRVSLPLLEAGIDLTCVDGSVEMLAQLQSKLAARGLTATLIHGDARRLTLDRRFAAAILPFNSISELVAPEDRLALLTNAHAGLVPGGRFVCTLHNPAVRKRSLGEPQSVRFPHPSGSGEVLFRLETELDPATDVVSGVETFQILAPGGLPIEQREVEIRFCLPGREEFEAAARQVGFTIEALHGDYDGSAFDGETSPGMIWVLRRPGSG